MKSFVLSSVLGACVLSSAAFSMGSEIELGSYNVFPGHEAKISLSTLPIYAGVVYNFECKLKSLEETSHLRLSTTSDTTQIWLDDCTYSAKNEVTCAIAKDKDTKFGFKRITKADGIITLRNLDFTQKFVVNCVAKVVS